MAASRLPAHWLRLQRGAEHLHRCGPRYVAHFSAAMTLGVPERMALLDKLDQWRRDIDPARARANGYHHPCIEWRMLSNDASTPEPADTTRKPSLRLVRTATAAAHDDDR
jgi:hypothetical protein